ncbi:hypothetical protein SAY87_000591 [Trapa incisa]|uniref:CASP-like protein n=2 Tax=Trapa TaxID=22665 RepID=A0AAN7MEA2_TRANT|nr:hypothetical protein SAY87_000591 [Trapa incisa]KAK4801761.1 hypothetical protein SAY86_022248 [Trapa natans]
MKDLIGGPGTVNGMVLRIGQSAFAAASIFVMVTTVGFYRYTAFCFLIASMGLQVLWSFGLTCLDIYALRKKRDLQNPVLVSLFVVGDWVTATLSLAASCASAGVVVLFARDIGNCKDAYLHSCRGFQISVGFAFIAWALIAMSSHVMFWMLASV